MKARNLPGRVLFFLALFAASPILATSGVVRWEDTFHRPLPGAGTQLVLAARELADGTTLTLVQDNYGLTTLRYDHDGNRIQTATFYSVYPFVTPPILAIDPFGAVAVAYDTVDPLEGSSDIWITKYDGSTGAALWPAPLIVGAGNHQDDGPIRLFIDPAGDVILESQNSSSGGYLTKYRGSDGQVLWGPIATPSIASTTTCQMDSSGDLFFADRSDFLDVFHLTKYSGATGEVVWRTSEPGHEFAPDSVGVDGSGNVVVTGVANPPGGGIEADRYSGATGQRIWGPATWTPASGSVSPSPLAAVGSDGSVAIFGWTYLAGTTTEVLLDFRGADGALQWGPVPNTDPNELNYGAVLTRAGNGDVILGALIQTGGSTSANVWRYDGNRGNLLWGPAGSANASVGAAFVGSNGRVFEALTTYNGTDDDVAVLERDAATGSAAWGPATFDGAAAGYASLWDLRATTVDGDVVATGVVSGPDGNGAWATVKYDGRTGETIWGPVYLPTGTYPTYSPAGVRIDFADSVLVGGYTSDGMTIVKYSGTTGQEIWTWKGAPGAITTGLALDAIGNVAIVGYGSNGSTNDAVVAKVSGASGSTIWGPVSYDSGSDDFPDSVVSDTPGNVIVAGHSTPPSGAQGFLVEYGANDGSTVWGPTTQGDLPSALALDSAGDVFRESCCGGITTSKYSGATGAVLWGPTTVGLAQSAYGTALAVDAAGDVVVTGSLYNGQTFDYAVLKYHGSDGAALWGPVTFDSGGSDWPYGIVVDGAGNAVVTGTSTDGVSELRTATVSFDGAAGARRWGPVGRNIGNGSVNGLAVSGSTVFVGATRLDLGYIIDAIDESLGIEALPGALPAVSCGHAIDVPLGAVNGTPPYTWSVTGGSLPPTVVLGAGGDLTGAPAGEGVFAFTVQVQDATLATAARDLTLAVGPSGPLVPISVVRDDSCQLTLSVAGSYASYEWLPGGQTTPQIVVDPIEPTTYGVVLNDGTSCSVRGAVAIAPLDPSCVAPTVASISPASGPGSGTPAVVAGSKFDASAALSIGGLPAAGLVFESDSALQATTPALSPGTVADVLVVNPDGRYGLLSRAFSADFLDVPSANPFYADVMKVLRAGITAGCGGGAYCPNGSVTRAQMAVFLLKAQHGFFYVPPPCTGIFADVACPGAFAADWIEQLSLEGITSGCGGGNYCPDAAVTREQMAVFLLKAEHGSSFTPPACVGIFGDVPCSSPFASWIEQLYAENITGGCGNGDYCPTNPNTRAQMAVFLSKTFALP